MDKKVLVVGGGFRSIMAAVGYQRRGFNVVLAEKGASIGGFMSPIKMGPYWVDKGPQYFDNFTDEDRDLMVEVLGQDLLVDLGFEYCTYFNRKRTDGFAIPDWRSLGRGFCLTAFDEILNLLQQDSSVQKPSNMDEFLKSQYGDSINHYLRLFSNKFLKQEAKKLSVEVLQMITFGGRALLFDQNQSRLLKTLPEFDRLLAGLKSTSGEKRYNLYPKGENLEAVRIALIKHLVNSGVTLAPNSDVSRINPDQKTVRINGKDECFDNVFLGLDCRDAEQILLGSESLKKHSSILPQYFHFICYSGPIQQTSYYTMDYELKHSVSRITHFHNYLGFEKGLAPLMCAEEPVNDAEIEQRDERKVHRRIKSEVCEVEGLDENQVQSIRSFFIPTTYKLPKNGFETMDLKFRERTQRKYGSYCIIPNSFTLTRKQTLDDLRTLGVLH